MAKKVGTKHHTGISLRDLNKIFEGNPNEIIPIPKGYAKTLSWRLSAHNISIDQIPKDAGKSIVDTETAEGDNRIQVTSINFD